jgi:hypothetical protein
MGLKSLVLQAFSEQLCFSPVAVAANERNRLDSGGCGSMVSMAVVAGRSRKLLFFEQRFSMDTGLPEQELIDGEWGTIGESITCHELGIGVASGTGVGHVSGVDG